MVLSLLGAQVPSLVTELRICKLWAKKKKTKNQREPLLTLSMQKSPRVGCEPSVFWALATRQSLWLHHHCSQVSRGHVVCPPPCGNRFTCVISLCSWFVFWVCPLSLTSSYLSDRSLLPQSWVSFGPHVISLWPWFCFQPVPPLSPSGPEPSLPLPSSAPASVTSRAVSLSALGR